MEYAVVLVEAPSAVGVAGVFYSGRSGDGRGRREGDGMDERIRPPRNGVTACTATVTISGGSSFH